MSTTLLSSTRSINSLRNEKKCRMIQLSKEFDFRLARTGINREISFGLFNLSLSWKKQQNGSGALHPLQRRSPGMNELLNKITKIESPSLGGCSVDATPSRIIWLATLKIRCCEPSSEDKISTARV